MIHRDDPFKTLFSLTDGAGVVKILPTEGLLYHGESVRETTFACTAALGLQDNVFRRCKVIGAYSLTPFFRIGESIGKTTHSDLFRMSQAIGSIMRESLFRISKAFKALLFLSFHTIGGMVDQIISTLLSPMSLFQGRIKGFLFTQMRIVGTAKGAIVGFLGFRASVGHGPLPQMRVS
jgi:hypothetical protein